MSEEEAKVEVKEEEVKVAANAPEAEVKTEDAAPAENAETHAEEAGADEEDGGAGEGEGEEEAGEDEQAEGGDDAAAEETTPAGEEPPKRKREAHVGPLTLGYKTFQNSKACADYFKTLLSTAPMDTDMNEYEYRILLDLIQQGHPSAEAKIGCGLRAFQVRHFNADTDSRAFFAIRKDGTLEDFSYVKCLGSIFPEEISFHPTKRNKDNGQHRKSSDGGRGGGFGRGRGGRGGSGGRGRSGRFGRGRGGRGGRH